MHMLRKLLREIHRRSVWQVLGTYAAASWAVLQVVDFLTGFVGLPTWTTRFAFALLLIGLPIVLATAVVQKGAPSLRGEYRDEVDPNELAGSTPEEVHVAPGEHPLERERLLTWRNATLGGVGAAVLLITSVVAYLVMWALGIGPVGSLVAQGTIDARDPVILADFGDQAGDSTLAGAVTEALRVDLVESKVLTLVDGKVVRDALQRMGREPGGHLTVEVAREVAVREGIKAVIEGAVSRVGSGYLLAARIVMPDDGHAVAAFRENATDDADLLPAIDLLSQRLREKVGESLRDVRAGPPLESVTTTSLDALRKFTEAKRAQARGALGSEIRLLHEAVALDSTFAMAWRGLAVAYYNLRSPQAAIDAATKAYENREHLTDRERQLAVAFYHQLVTGDQAAEIAAYSGVLEDHPDDPSALNNLATAHMRREEWGDAAELLERAVSGPARSLSAFDNLVVCLYNAGRKDELPAVFERWNELYEWSSALISLQRATSLLGSGEPDSARAVIREARAEGGDRINPLLFYGDGLDGRIALSQGKLGEAERSLREDLSAVDARGWKAPAIGLAEALLQVHLVAGADAVAELRALEREAEKRWADLSPLDRPYDDLGLYWAEYGHDADRAERWWDQLRKATPESVKAGREFAADELYRRQWISLLQGRPADALDDLRELQRRRPCKLCNLREEAAAFEALQQPDSAIAALERWVAGDEFNRAVEREDGLGTVLPELARLYERVGRLDDARATWLRFADRWADADAALQPRVRAARARAAELTERAQARSEEPGGGGA